MSVIMTAAGEALKARLQAEGKPLVIDTFVFAHIPNLDPTEQLTPGITVPTEQVVYAYPIPDEYRAYVNPNQVVYSALLGSDVGDWSFNWQGLVCSEYDTLIAAATFPTLEKRKYSGATGAAGNNLTRNFLLEFSGAKELTGITVSADVWQLDFTIRLLGMDERERLSNFDLYGAGWFSGDGWKLARQGGQYACAPGFGYVGGIRAELAEPMPVVATFTPADVWLDVCLKPQGSDRVATAAPMVVEPDTEVPFSAADETGLMHYRTLIAHVDAGGGITDKRQPMNGTDGASGQLADVQRLMKRKVNAGKGLTGGGPLSSDVTLSAKLDGKTVQADAGDAITVKDVAIEGNQEDLASARGQIGDLKVATATEYPSILTIRKSCRLYFNGTEWGKVADRPFDAGYGAVVIADVSSALRGEIWTFSLSGNDAWKAQFNEKGTSPFARFVMSNAIGDGIRVTNGIISVPEYEGATTSTAGTRGLVPPAAAGQQESFLTGGGEYKPALSKISDSVSLADSKTAASAKAVKTAYDLANGKQPSLGFTPVQQGGGSGQDNSKIYIGHGTNGLKAQIGTTDLGYIVTTAAGTTKAANSASADRAQVAGSAETLFVTGWGNTKWGSTPYGQSPLYVWCLPTGGSDMEPCSPSVLSAGAANWCTYTPNVAVGDNSAVPQGGTWKYFSWGYDAATNGVVAGGTNISNRFIAIRVS
ncbi:hypothetical protein Bwad005_27870 [Bilophila wadsworthia]